MAQKFAVEQLIPVNTDGRNVYHLTKSRYDACRLVCAICPGYCCYRFNMRMPRKKNGHINIPELKANWVGQPEEEAAADFVAAHMHKERYPAAMNRWGTIAMSCDCHDPKTRMCSAYADRPTFCKKYFCSSALEGKLPTRANFPHQIKMMIRAGLLDPKEVPAAPKTQQASPVPAYDDPLSAMT